MPNRTTGSMQTAPPRSPDPFGRAEWLERLRCWPANFSTSNGSLGCITSIRTRS